MHDECVQRLSELRTELHNAREAASELATKLQKAEQAQQEQAAGSGLEEDLVELREANKALDTRVVELVELEHAATTKVQALQASMEQLEAEHAEAHKEQQTTLAHLREQLDVASLAQAVRWLLLGVRI